MPRDIRQQYLFARLDELSSEDKNTVFAQACLFEPERAYELELLRSLVSGDKSFVDLPDESTGSIALPVMHALNLALQSLSIENPGTIIGSYLLVELIGRGGFSTVWRAQQQHPVRREVALKIIKIGMDTHEVIARFEAERQALALMSHPNIAAVFDAGTTESGRPFFVMELIQGIPVTEYCDKNRLSIRQRLKLFVDVCHGVNHAHQKGIIHRDLKPSNILVTDTDEGPVPKIIDFGIAKAEPKSLTSHTLHTELLRFMGTPVYSSPEHLQSGGVDVDADSDVYSLGVTLYELLAGTLPYDLDTLHSRNFDEARRILLQSDSPRLNQRLRSLQNDDLRTIAENRNTQPTTLLRMSQGDIEWIVYKCLEKDRARRYNSLAGLIGDLENFLLDKPVIARPPSRWYLISKTIMRHRVSALWIGIVVISIILGTILTITGHQNTVNERRIAQNAQMKTDEIAKFITEDVYWNQRDYGQNSALINTLEKTIKFLDQNIAEVRLPETLKAYARALEKLVYEMTLPDANNLDEEYLGKMLSTLEKALDLRREVARMSPDDVENSRTILKNEMDDDQRSTTI